MNTCRLSGADVEVPCVTEFLAPHRGKLYSNVHVHVWVLADTHDAIALLAHGNKTVGEIPSNVWKEVG